MVVGPELVWVARPGVAERRMAASGGMAACHNGRVVASLTKVLAGVALGVAVGCRVGGEQPVPFTGPVPARMVVWPGLSAAFAPAAPVLLASLGPAAQRRGYDVVTAAVARQVLEDQMPPETAHAEPVGASLASLQQVGTVLAVDAVLCLDVREFSATGEPLQYATWDLAWEVVAASSGHVLWRFAHRGSWRRPADAGDPLRRLDADPEIVPIGGDRVPGFRDVPELAAWLHRLAMEHLPVRQP